MEHVAIMRRQWKLTRKILSGKKRIEMRWYKSKYAPWGKINRDDILYFKDSGFPVTIRSKVDKVICFSGLKPKLVKNLLNKYGNLDGLDKNSIPKFYELFKNKNYCIVVFIKDAKRIMPFGIDKKGFGVMSAWITINKVDKIKVN